MDPKHYARIYPILSDKTKERMLLLVQEDFNNLNQEIGIVPTITKATTETQTSEKTDNRTKGGTRELWVNIKVFDRVFAKVEKVSEHYGVTNSFCYYHLRRGSLEEKLIEKGLVDPVKKTKTLVKRVDTSGQVHYPMS